MVVLKGHIAITHPHVVIPRGGNGTRLPWETMCSALIQKKILQLAGTYPSSKVPLPMQGLKSHLVQHSVRLHKSALTNGISPNDLLIGSAIFVHLTHVPNTRTSRPCYKQHI